MQDMKDALRWLELEERRVRLLEREAKALSIIAPSLRRKADEGDSDDTQDSVRHFLSSYARRGDAEAKVEIAISTFFSKYMQYSTVRNLQRIPRKEFYQAIEVYCWFAGSLIRFGCVALMNRLICLAVLSGGVGHTEGHNRRLSQGRKVNTHRFAILTHLEYA